MLQRLVVLCTYKMPPTRALRNTLSLAINSARASQTERGAEVRPTVVRYIDLINV